jgi:hypothetical protein
MPGPWSVARVLADDRVVQGPLVYHGAYLRADGVGAATADVYDGSSTGGQLRDGLRAATSEHDQHLYDAGIAFNNGLFVDLGSNVDVLLVYWSPIEPDGEQ